MSGPDSVSSFDSPGCSVVVTTTVWSACTACIQQAARAAIVTWYGLAGTEMVTVLPCVPVIEAAGATVVVVVDAGAVVVEDLGFWLRACGVASEPPPDPTPSADREPDDREHGDDRPADQQPTPVDARRPCVPVPDPEAATGGASRVTGSVLGAEAAMRSASSWRCCAVTVSRSIAAATGAPRR